MDRIAPSQVACMLCREGVYFDGGDQEQYEGHLRDAHGVWSNRLWIVEQTFLKQRDEESFRTGVKDGMTRIKVKKLVESENEDISDLQVLSDKLEDSFTCEPVRRSSRKRSASRSSSERHLIAKKIKDVVTIREPEDLLLKDEALNSSSNNEVSTHNSQVPMKQSRHDSTPLDLNMNCQVNTDPEPSSQSKSVSFDIGEECESKCEECKEIFKVSFMELHVKNIHGVSLKDYLEVHGDPQTGKMKLSSTFYHFCSFCSVKLLMIRSEVKEHLVTKHKTSLKTFDGEVMKTKDVNGNESVASNEAEVVTSECLISSSDEDGRENKLESKLNDPGLVDDSVISECLTSTDDDAEPVATDESIVKPKSESQFPKLLNSKFYSDSFDDSCIVECSICDKHLPIERLRGHTSSQHHLPIAKYKEQFGSQPAFVKTTYHLCKLCGKEVLLDKDSIATHVRGAHRWTAKQYNSEHMVMRKRKVGQVDEDLTLFKLGESVQEDEVAETSILNKQHWFDANTFTCKMCMFASTSLDVFKKHVKLTHKMSLSKFSCWYSRTDALYTCQCCDKEVYHERSSIKAHVEGHLLSMQQYASLYERRKILELESEKKDKLECCVVWNNSHELEFHNVGDADNDPEKDPLEITITEDCDPVESPPAQSLQLLVSASPSVQGWSPVVLPAQEAGDRLVGVIDFIAEIVESIIPPFGRSDAHTDVTGDDGSCSVSSTTLLDDKCDTSSLLVSGSTDVTAPSTPTLPDIFLYMCPFHGCDFHTDFKGMQSGVAAKHGVSLHQQVVERGLEWKKLSLETRMEQLFAGN